VNTQTKLEDADARIAYLEALLKAHDIKAE